MSKMSQAMQAYDLHWSMGDNSILTLYIKQDTFTYCYNMMLWSVQCNWDITKTMCKPEESLKCDDTGVRPYVRLSTPAFGT